MCGGNRARGIPGSLVVKNQPASEGRSPEKEMAPHPRILAWEVPWTEEPEGYCSWGPKELDMTEHTHIMCGALWLELNKKK